MPPNTDYKVNQWRNTIMTIRQPIITVAGHVDHGKTSILDCFRGSTVQVGEAGGITQKISFTKYPVEQICKTCATLDASKLKIPGFLFIDTPGHAAFTNLRKRGGSLADLAVLVVDIKEGIKPQTAEVISILKANKTPFVIALNKVDTISGWQKKESIAESLNSQAMHVKQEFDTALLTFQGAMQSHGFETALFNEITDFTKHIAIVPCSAKTDQGISELLSMLCGLSQKFLTERLTLSEDAKGVVLEIKKERGMDCVEAILYDGTLREGDEIAVATIDGNPLIAKVRALEEIKPLSHKYESTKETIAATGVRLHLTNKEGLLSGMPLQKINNNVDEITESFKTEIAHAMQTDKQGIIAKADSLGSLEALLTLLKQSNINVVKAGIGPISKKDLISAKANLEINQLDALIVGFNVEAEEDLKCDTIKVLTNEVVYKLIEDVNEWRKMRLAEIEKERLMGLATICKLEILPQFVFRNSNPAIFGVRIVAGTLKTNTQLIDDRDEQVARVKAIQEDKQSVASVIEGKEVAISLPGTTFDRQLKDTKYLFAQLSEKQFRQFKENKDLLASSEISALQEVAALKRTKNTEWGL